MSTHFSLLKTGLQKNCKIGYTVARDYIQARTSIKPQLAMILGSGLGNLVYECEIDAQFPTNEIPHLPVPTKYYSLNPS